MRQKLHTGFQNSIFLKKSIYDTCFLLDTLIHSAFSLFLWHVNFLQSMDVNAFVALLEQNGVLLPKK